MNIQIFGKKKCFDTKKAERYFKERRIKYQMVDLARFGMSKGELSSVKAAVGGLEPLVDEKAEGALLLRYLASEDAKIEKLLESPALFRTPIVRNGKQATVGYCPKCTTCQKAKKWLEENGIPYTDRHIVEQNPTVEELKEWHTRSGRELKRFFNTSGLLYKSMHLKEKLPEMPPEEQFERLATNGMLVKRPLLVGDDFVLIGFRPAEWEAWKEAHA